MMDNLLTPQERHNILAENGFAGVVVENLDLLQLMEATEKALLSKLQVTDEKMELTDDNWVAENIAEFLNEGQRKFFANKPEWRKHYNSETVKNELHYSILNSFGQYIRSKLFPLLKAKEQQVRQEGKVDAYLDIQTDLMSISCKDSYQTMQERTAKALKKVNDILIQRQSLE